MKRNNILPIFSSYRISKSVRKANDEFDVVVSVILNIDYSKRKMSILPDSNRGSVGLFQFHGAALDTFSNEMFQILLWKTVAKLIIKATKIGHELLEQYEEENPQLLPF